MFKLRSAVTRGLIALPLLAGLALAHPAMAAHHTAHKTYTVKMEPSGGHFAFVPAKLTIHVGDTVKWVDVNSVPHNIVGMGSAAKVINKMAIDSASYKVTFKKKGTYKYECQVHLPFMVGQIVVK